VGVWVAYSPLSDVVFIFGPPPNVPPKKAETSSTKSEQIGLFSLIMNDEPDFRPLLDDDEPSWLDVSDDGVPPGAVARSRESSPWDVLASAAANDNRGQRSSGTSTSSSAQSPSGHENNVNDDVNLPRIVIFMRLGNVFAAVLLIVGSVSADVLYKKSC